MPNGLLARPSGSSGWLPSLPKVWRECFDCTAEQHDDATVGEVTGIGVALVRLEAQEAANRSKSVALVVVVHAQLVSRQCPRECRY